MATAAASVCALLGLLAATSRALAIVTTTGQVRLAYRYHDHDHMTAYLQRLGAAHPHLVSLHSVGRSVRGRELWVAEVSAADTARLGVPHVKLIGNIHGNEPAGREIILHLAHYLVTNYNRSEELRWLLDNTRIHLMPSMNPDGFQNSREGVCHGNRGRENARNVDLNRNFPDHFRRNTIPAQPERDAVMAWSGSRPFLLSASLHGGALVANYPYDNTPEDKTGHLYEPSLTPDDDVFVHLATSYAAAHPSMHDSPTVHLGTACGSHSFKRGVTNGAAWYPFTGGMQDYNYVVHGCLELTLEISCCKYPSARFLPQLWDENRQALLEFIAQAHRGVKGVVRNYMTNESVPGAFMTVTNRNIGFTTSERGEFWRILLPGNYNLKVHKEGYENLTMSFSVVEPAKPWTVSAMWLDVALYPAGLQVTSRTPPPPHPTPPTTASSSSSSSTVAPPTSTTPRTPQNPCAKAHLALQPRAPGARAQARSLSTAAVARVLHASTALLAPLLHFVYAW